MTTSNVYHFPAQVNYNDSDLYPFYVQTSSLLVTAREALECCPEAARTLLIASAHRTRYFDEPDLEAITDLTEEEAGILDAAIDAIDGTSNRAIEAGEGNARNTR